MSDELEFWVQALIDSAINPAVTGHGGFVELLDVKDSKAYLQMGGSCQRCGAADITLEAGIERLLKEQIPDLEEVFDATGHGSSTNPYNGPGK
jgi:Fe/S biogenesis protein NfuA